MKSLKLFSTLIFLAIALSLFSCKKTGPAGPQGEQGEQGPKGDKGPQGIAGADGSMIYSGNGSPDTETGQAGDYYLDKNNGNLYGPKTDKGWGDPLSLKGPKGEKGETGSKGEKGDPGKNGKDGQAGSQILSGKSKPASSIGNTGDYYWDISTYTLYGPKTAAGWESGVMLRGPKGDKGDPGTANVMYSDWQSFNWGSYNTYQAREIVSVPRLTEDFMNTGGTILVYVRVNNNPFGHTYYQLPANLSILYNCRLQYFIRTKGNSLIFDLFPTSGNLSNQFVGNDYAFRYVLIPGGVHARKSSPPPDPKDYKATCEYYGIPE